jgi:hypothetical protein
MLCKAEPERAWEALALLDQHHRRGRVSAELCRSVRHKLERQALGLEEYRLEDARAECPECTPPAARTAHCAPRSHTAGAANGTAIAVCKASENRADQTASGPAPPSRTTRLAWLRTAPIIVLAALMLSVAATPDMHAPPKTAEALGPVPSAPAPPPTPPALPAEQIPPIELVSLTSDRYIVAAHARVAEISVQRSREAAGEARFVWWTRGSGARPDEDYTGGSPKVAQLADGEVSMKLYIPILTNPSRHHIRMFYVLLGRAGGGAAPGPIRRAAVFIMPVD